MKKSITFKSVYIGESFICNGTIYTKRSTRTAHLKHNKSIWFYFSQNQLVDIHPGYI